MTISVGDRFPEATFKTMGADGAKDIKADELFSGKKVVLFGVPGAFTPTCSNNHLPGFLENFDAIKAKGIDTLAVVATNDPYVMGAWARFTGGEGKMVYLSDPNAEFVKAAGLDMDTKGGALAIRSKRFSMIVDDGQVTSLNVEESPGQAVESGAARLMEQL